MDVNLHNQDNSEFTGEVFRVGLLVTEGFALMSYACVVEPLRAANLLAQKPLYEVHHFSSSEAATEALTIQSSGAASIDNLKKFSAEMPLDLMLVIAGGDPFSIRDKQIDTALRSLDQAGVQLGGVSGGPVLLAKAGLMKGRRMTVHWEHAGQLAQEVPDLLLERRLYVIDRDRVTCGGGIAPLDMMHSIIAAHHGAGFAQLVSDWFLHTEIRAAAAPQRGGLPTRLGTHSQPVIEAVSAMEDHIADPLTLEQLAMIVGITARHLGRLFQTELGLSTMDFYRHLRLDIGRRLLRESQMAVSDIAQSTGFSSAEHFSNAYLARFDIRPSLERKQSN